MSFELPEAFIIAGQMEKELVGKVVSSWNIRDSKKMQSIGFMNKDERDYNILLGGEITDPADRDHSDRVADIDRAGPDVAGPVRTRGQGQDHGRPGDLRHRQRPVSSPGTR